MRRKVLLSSWERKVYTKHAQPQTLETAAFHGWTEGIEHSQSAIMSPLINWIITREAARGGHVRTILILLEIEMKLLRRGYGAPSLCRMKPHTLTYCNPDAILIWGAQFAHPRVIFLARSLGAHKFIEAIACAAQNDDIRAIIVLQELLNHHDADCICSDSYMKRYLTDVFPELAEAGRIKAMKFLLRSELSNDSQMHENAFERAAGAGKIKTMKFLKRLGDVDLVRARSNAVVNNRKRAIALIDKWLRE